MHQNHYFYSVFSKKKKILSPPQKIEEHYLWTQSRYFFFLLSFFSAFLLFWVFAVSGFLGGLFLRGMKKQKKTKFKTKQPKNKKGRRTTRCKQEDHLVLWQKTTTQKQNNTNEFFKLERNNTRKTNKNKNIKHKNQTTLLTNRTQKTPELQGKQPFSRDWKQNKKEK